jgi:hypothetical protein
MRGQPWSWGLIVGFTSQDLYQFTSHKLCLFIRFRGQAEDKSRFFASRIQMVYKPLFFVMVCYLGYHKLKTYRRLETCRIYEPCSFVKRLAILPPDGVLQTTAIWSAKRLMGKQSTSDRHFVKYYKVDTRCQHLINNRKVIMVISLRIPATFCSH